MDEVTEILKAAAGGEPEAAARLMPLVYDELRRLAAQKLAQEKPGQTLQPTALVHEAYLRLVGANADQQWHGRGPQQAGGRHQAGGQMSQPRCVPQTLRQIGGPVNQPRPQGAVVGLLFGLL
jgi:ECF sigma factor